MWRTMTKLTHDSHGLQMHPKPNYTKNVFLPLGYSQIPIASQHLKEL